MSTQSKDAEGIAKKRLAMITKVRESGLLAEQISGRENIPRPDSRLLFQTKDERVKQLLR